MAIVKLQGEQEKRQGIYYEFDNAQKPLGEGGMGKVFRGRQVNVYTNTTRDVAIKFMFAGLPPNVIKRAEDEANIKIHNENLVEMMGFLTIEDQANNGTKMVRYHVVSELLIGVSLSDLIQGIVTDQSGQEMPYAQALYKMYNTAPEQFAVLIIKKLLSGIMALHDAGYIHRDIDPSNIMITRDEKVKLIDFGIAKKVGGLKTHDRNLTTAGQFMGKPQYAAPELIVGDLKNQNKPTDIYAIGVMLFQLITGHLPYEGPSNVVLNAHLHSKMPLKQVKDSQLRKILERATEKDCTKRYQSAAEFRVDLDSYSNGGGSNKKFDTKILAYAAAGVLALSIVVLALIKFINPNPNPDEPTLVAEQIDETKDTAHQNHASFTNVRKQLLDPDQAKAAFATLQKMADEGDVDAKFTLSRLYAISSGPYILSDDYLNMQANLKDEIQPDAVQAHEMLKEIISDHSDYYPALCELAYDYYAGKPLSGNDDINLRRAKSLLESALVYANNAEDIPYKNKINSLLERY